MNCQEFQERLDSHEPLALPPDCEAHAKGCSACRKKAELHRRLSDGVQVLRASCRPPDLASAIRSRIAAREPAPEGVAEKLRRWWEMISPTTPFKASLFYGVAGLVIFALCWTVIEQHASRIPTRTAVPGPVWQVAFLSGSVPPQLDRLLPGGKGEVPPGTSLETGPSGAARIQLAGRCDLEVRNARLELQADGFRLHSGTARAKIQPTPDRGKAFQAWTPLAVVTVLGTEYSLDLSEETLIATVHSGRVRVELPSGQTRILAAGEAVTVGRDGWLPPSEPKPASMTPGTDRPEVPED